MPVSSGANFQDPHGKGFLRYRRWTNYRQTPRVEFKYKYDSHTSSPFEQCLANPQQDQSISRMQWVLGWHGSTRYGFAVTYSGFSAGSFLYLGAVFTPSAYMGVLGMAPSDSMFQKTMVFVQICILSPLILTQMVQFLIVKICPAL